MDRRILVIGGGISGVQAGLDLAQMGIQVTLVEEKPNIGGRMAQLDKTFPTNDCSTCILSPKLVELASHSNVDIFTCSSIEDVVKLDERFQARIRKRARFVDEEKCTACGVCAEKCPVKVSDLFNKSITTSKCISIPYAQAVPAVYKIDKEYCLYLTNGKCGICKKVCPADAIDYEQKDTIEAMDFNSIIIATGTEEFTPQIRPEYGYKVYENVLTSIEYERFLSASGPTNGQIVRPSDGKLPSQIAFIQCVGSRDVASGNYGYCSSYCCMQATKDAIITKEHNLTIDSTIFYIDIRAYGKDFDKFVDRAKTEYGVKYIKSRISEILEAPDTKNLIIKYITPDGKIRIEEFDLVILSVGIRIPDKSKNLLRGLGVELDEYGFCRCSTFQPGETNVDGVYVCGTVTGPMDIPEAVVSAGAAASLAARGLLSPDTSSEIMAEKPGEVDTEAKPLNIGVIVCHCGTNIASVVDVPSVVEFSRSLPNVKFAHELLYACSQDSIRLIINKIKEHDLNRIVVASCSPRTHESTFQSGLEKAGLNKYLLQMTNIRDQCSWVHQNTPELATQKAKDLVRMAVGKSRYLEPLYELYSDVNKACLVIGGGIAGMTAALFVADNGYQVYLIEKESELGGNLLKISYLLPEEDIVLALQRLIRRIEEHPLIELFLNANIKDIKGYVGNFTTNFTTNDEEKSAEHGTVIVATGAREHETESYGYKTDPYVVTQREFETVLKNKNPLMKYVNSIAMIQCVDSREGERNYCSRVCCGQAIKNILQLKKDYPDKDVYVLYRDMRTYGLREPYYAVAREAGALFLRYEKDRKPVVEKIEQGNFKIKLFNEILGKDIYLPVQLIVLSVGIDSLETNGQVAKMLKVPLNEDGFFNEAHVKLRPVDFSTSGVFVCGMAHGPKHIDESIVQAIATAAHALTIVTRDKISSEAYTASVDESRCSGCGLCVEVCVFGAIEIDEESERAGVNTLLCKGCGTCVAACFSSAIDLRGFTNKQIINEFQELFL
ncbi:MAG: CoB--CoM heterodisulfide reductase iron-sulfur subunit A family protein [Spirochaetota bacterium]|nr:MAG: CoB--CoM heterodisulfide reductase iron-sulfur subunit A family protein [Spirochaetota bacterium]